MKKLEWLRQRLDPFYVMVNRQLKPFYAEPPDWVKLPGVVRAQNVTGRHKFLRDNTWKHADILWWNVACLLASFYGMYNLPKDVLGNVLVGLLGVSTVTGGAWFIITFASIPDELAEVAMQVTYDMFAAFTCSLTTTFVAISYSVEHNLAVLAILLFVFARVLRTCISYDTTDGLRLGLDKALFRNALAGLKFYQNQGVRPEDIGVD